MRSFTIEIDEKYFNLIWRSIALRESELLEKIAALTEGSDEAALLGNEVVYIRLCKKDLEAKAKSAAFSSGSFSQDDEFMDLSDMQD